MYTYIYLKQPNHKFNISMCNIIKDPESEMFRNQPTRQLTKCNHYHPIVIVFSAADIGIDRWNYQNAMALYMNVYIPIPWTEESLSALRISGLSG